MQTPDERRRLMAEGRYTELEHPSAIALRPMTRSAWTVAAASARQAVEDVFGREPGEDG